MISFDKVEKKQFLGLKMAKLKEKTQTLGGSVLALPPNWCLNKNACFIFNIFNFSDKKNMN